MTPEASKNSLYLTCGRALAIMRRHCANALETENQSQNGSDGDNGNSGNGNGGNGNENPDENGRGDRPVVRECTYQDFMKCQPLNFKGTEGDCTNLWNSHRGLLGTDSVLPKRFQELTMMCTKMVPEEEDRVEKFIRGLPDNIHGNVIVAEPQRLQDVVLKLPTT
ncbi:hypothetical protein Tco_0128110 [Tanacetum coccineum]